MRGFEAQPFLYKNFEKYPVESRSDVIWTTLVAGLNLRFPEHRALFDARVKVFIESLPPELGTLAIHYHSFIDERLEILEKTIGS